MKKATSRFLVLFLSVCINYVTCTPDAPKNLVDNNLLNQNNFTQEELSTAIEQSEKTNNIKINNKIKNRFAEKMKDYKVTGFSFCVDPNFAFILDTQNPTFNITYKNSNGEIKSRKYKAEIHSLGIKWEATIKFNLIFFVGTDLNFYNTDKKIEIESGFDIESSIFDFTYAKFNNAPGGMIIFGIPVPQVAIFGPTTLCAIFDYPTLEQKLRDQSYATAINQTNDFWDALAISQRTEEILKLSKFFLFLFCGAGISLVTGGSLIPIS